MMQSKQASPTAASPFHERAFDLTPLSLRNDLAQSPRGISPTDKRIDYLV